MKRLEILHKSKESYKGVECQVCKKNTTRTRIILVENIGRMMVCNKCLEGIQPKQDKPKTV